MDATIKFEIVNVLHGKTQIYECAHDRSIGFSKWSITGFRSESFTIGVARAAATDGIAKTIDNRIGRSGSLTVKQIQTIRLQIGVTSPKPNRIEVTL